MVKPELINEKPSKPYRKTRKETKRLAQKLKYPIFD